MEHSDPTPQLSWPQIAGLFSTRASDRWIPVRVKHWRAIRGMSLQQLADAVTSRGVVIDRGAIWKIENPDKPSGGRSVSVGEAIALAGALGLSLLDLILDESALEDPLGWLAFRRAADHLNDARFALAQYREAMDEVHHRMSISTALADELRRYLNEAWRLRQEQLREVWERDYQDDFPRFADYLKRFGTTPAIDAATDAVEGPPLDRDILRARDVEGEN